MSEPIGGGCTYCGLTGGFHKRSCEFWLSDLSDPPPPTVVYDLAEFERQLQARFEIAKEAELEREVRYAVKLVLDALRASKREAK